MGNGRLACWTLAVMAGAAWAQGGDGRVLWRLELGSPVTGAEVSVGPDGTIYASDDGHLYSVAPDGTPRWSRAGLGGGRPVDFLSDGTLVTGLGDSVHALDPADGSDLWTFSFDGNGGRERIEVGPNIGPDGNVYAVSSTDGEHGLGAFSLTPAGGLRWSDGGDPLLDPLNASTGGPVRFAGERAVFPFNSTHDSAPFIYGYDLGGRQTLFVDFTCTGAPRVDPLGRLIVTGACGVEAMDPDGGEVYWRVDLGSTHIAPVIGTDATVYAGDFLRSISAIRADGSIAWSSSAVVDPVRIVAVRQDMERLVYVSAGFGSPQSLAVAETAGGTPLWSVPLRSSGGHHELVETWEAPTSPDGRVVYLATRFTSLGAPGALYAVSLVEPCAADFNGDGSANTLDVLDFLNAWTSGDPEADFNQDGSINTLDVLAFLNEWGAGC